MTSFILLNHDLIPWLSRSAKLLLVITGVTLTVTSKIMASLEDDARAVAWLDTKYQAAVKANDATTMDQILTDDFILVTGRGHVYNKAELIEQARRKEVTYEHQEEEVGSQKVRVWGDTAVVTALLWVKAVQEGKPVDYKSGSAILMFALRQAGDMYLARPRCRCLKQNQSKIVFPSASAK